MKYAPSRGALALVAGVALALAGLVAITPAGASLQQQVSAAADHNWNKIWKNKLQPKADERYYTKSKSNKRYADVDEVYSKTDSDARYATKPKLLRGTYSSSLAGAAGNVLLADISFGVSLPAVPTTHYINQGAAVPAGCSGTAEAPDAQAGHLCLFESLASNVGTRTIYRVSPVAPDSASTMGAWVVGTLTAAGSGYYGGSWAVRFDTASAGTRAPAPSGRNILK